MSKFNQQYWDEMYAEEDGSIIDGIHNAKEHANYLKSTLDLAEINISSIADFGFGKGILLREISKAFKPKRIMAIDPSTEAVKGLEKSAWIHKVKHKIIQTTIENLDTSSLRESFDLGICNSIFQYIESKDITYVMHKLAHSCKYLYFSVPTKVDYEYMKKELKFEDPYAFRRSRKFYRSSITPYFTVVSNNLLESKILIKESNFVYELFRF